MNAPNLQRQTEAMAAQISDLHNEVRRLRQIVDGAPPGIAVPEIGRLLHAAAAEFGVSVPFILSARRNAHVVLARQVVMHIAATRLNRSLPVIGRCMKRDHSTVFHGLRRIAERTAADPDLAARIERVAATIQPQPKETAA